MRKLLLLLLLLVRVGRTGGRGRTAVLKQAPVTCHNSQREWWAERVFPARGRRSPPVEAAAGRSTPACPFDPRLAACLLQVDAAAVRRTSGRGMGTVDCIRGTSEYRNTVTFLLHASAASNIANHISILCLSKANKQWCNDCDNAIGLYLLLRYTTSYYKPVGYCRGQLNWGHFSVHT